MRLSLALLALSATPLAAESYPFMGSWNCEVSDFTFTPDTYQPGEGTDPLPIAMIDDFGDGSYQITMEDGYFIFVSMNDDGTMGWLSGESGDAFTCVSLD